MHSSECKTKQIHVTHALSLLYLDEHSLLCIYRVLETAFESLLHCVSIVIASKKETTLRVMMTEVEAFGLNGESKTIYRKG